MGNISRRYNYLRRKEKRMENGLCYACGGVKEDEIIMRCNKCKKTNRKSCKKRQEDRKNIWKKQK